MARICLDLKAMEVAANRKLGICSHLQYSLGLSRQIVANRLG